MKKVDSWTLFILVIAIFLFDVYFTIDGAIDVKNRFDELTARGAGGHEYLGVGVEVLLILSVFVSAVGMILSIVSSKIAQNFAIRIISVMFACLFIVAIPTCFGITYI